MDGASKYVKGDATAGLVITAINFVGGLVLGVMMQGAGYQRGFAALYDSDHW